VSSLPDFMLAPGPGRTDAATLARDVSDPPANDPAVDAPPRREPPPFVPGVFPGMPAADYFAIEALSQSGCKSILRSPAHFRLERDSPSAPTPAMQFGTAVHDGVLEPDQFDLRVVAAPQVNKRTNAGKDELAEFYREHGGKIVLSPYDFDRARRCVDAVRAHPSARYLLTGAIVETPIFWIDREHDVPCKARIDARNHGGLIDLKTTSDASAEDFAKSIANFGYHTQAAFYFSGCEHALDATPEFFVDIAVESEAPYAVACYALPSEAIQTGAAHANEALRRYAAARKSGTWCAYPDTIQGITLPRWATRVAY